MFDSPPQELSAEETADLALQLRQQINQGLDWPLYRVRRLNRVRRAEPNPRKKGPDNASPQKPGDEE